MLTQPLASSAADAVADPMRVAAVRRLAPLYQPASPQFDRLTRLAAHVLEAPLALLTLIDADRQFIVSAHGLEEPFCSAREMSLDYSICKHTIRTRNPFVVEDTSSELSLVGNRSVEELKVGSYAGAPLVSVDGYCVGALCAVDFKARQWTREQVKVLCELATISMDQIRLAGLDRQMAFEREWRGVADRSLWSFA